VGCALVLDGRKSGDVDTLDTTCTFAAGTPAAVIR
jgi:hypothetical protein